MMEEVGTNEEMQKLPVSREVELSPLMGRGGPSHPDMHSNRSKQEQKQDQQRQQQQQKQHLEPQQKLQSEYQSTSLSLSSLSLPSIEFNDQETTDLQSPQSPSKGAGGGHGHCGPPGTADAKQVAVNIFISFVGAGMLGMPYAFSQSGWLLGTVALSVTSTANVYAMLLLVKTRKNLESKGHDDILGYGDVGRVVAGPWGESLVNSCLVMSQLGFGTAYLIFVAANLYSIAEIDRALTCLCCVPILAVMVQFQDMKKLSPFSLFADISNVVGLSAVLFQDYENHRFRAGEDLVAVNVPQLVYVIGVAIYSLEGVGLVLPLESSYVEREKFPSLLKRVICGITALMIVFGWGGYYAFGSFTETPITLNLSGEWATVVKLCLCVGLYLTFPVMMFPVNEVMEDFFLGEKMRRPNRIFRTSVVIFSATLAYAVPDFGKFLSLVGSSICTILGFILPCYFHLVAFGRKELKCWEIVVDFVLIGVGFAFGALGTYQSLVDILEGNDKNHEGGQSGSRTLNSILNL